MINSNIVSFLTNKGFSISNYPFEIIDTCYAWYSNDNIVDFHDRMSLQGVRYELNRSNFAKRACADEANLCEVININASGENNEYQHLYVNNVLNKNNFSEMFRHQLELVPAIGTVGAYIRIDNVTVYDDGTISDGDIRINYIDARGIIPLTIINGQIIDCAFVGDTIINGVKNHVLVIFNKMNDNNYYYSSYTFSNSYKLIKEQTIENYLIGEVKPFSILQNAEVNNIDKMDGYGLPKIWNCIPTLKSIDLAYNVIFSDLDKAEKIVMINELMCKFDKDGKPILNEQQKKVFVFLGEKLPEEKTLFQEYNPVIRIEEVKNSMEFLLSILSSSFGFGTRKYTFENTQFNTATEAIISKADCMQELNRQRANARRYISDLCRAIMFFANKFNNENFDVNSEILVDFDDSIIIDRGAQLESDRNDALSFGLPWLTQNYLMKKYNLTAEEAKEIYLEGNIDLDLEEDSEV